MQSSGWTPPAPLPDIAENVTTSPEFTSASSGIIDEEKTVQNAPACPAPKMVHELIPITVHSDVDDVQSVRSSGSSSQNARAAEIKAKRAELEMAKAKEYANSLEHEVAQLELVDAREMHSFTLFGGLHKEQTDGTRSLQLKCCIAWQGSGVTHSWSYECTALLERGVTVHYR